MNEKSEKLQRMGSKWLERIIASEKREEDWRKDAEAAEKAYSGDEKSQEGKKYDFNILHSNVETIVPSIYNSTPVPDIRRRFLDDDPVAKELGDLIERAITVLIDDNRLDTEIEQSAQDAFLSGRAVVRLRFDADWVDQPVSDDAGEPLTDENGEPQTEEVAQDERILFEAVSWRDFRCGPAKRFEDVNWIAFKHSIPREEMERLSDPELLDEQRGADEITLKEEEDDDIVIWEIWCRETKTVKFIRDSDRKVMKIQDDPLGLAGFFPIPPPVQPITLTGKLTPICPFSIYKRLADELDLITKRIMKITSTLKVRGVTFGDASDIKELSEAGDGEIIVARNLEQLAQTKGLDGAISWWPIEPAAKVLAQLYLNREQTKQAIYEITGISDIIRGKSSPSETLGAQEIKTQWGALRIKKMQRLIERQVRDIFVLMTEIIAKHFSPETLQRMTGIQVTEEMQRLLEDGPARNYRIDVESDSTVRADMTRMRGEMGKFLEGTGAFMQAVGPVIEARPELGGPMAEVYGAFARQFRLGKQAEDALESMAQAAREPQPEEGPSPEDMQMQADQAKMQADQQARQAEMGLKGEELKLKVQAQQADTAMKGEELKLKAAEVKLKAEAQAFAQQAGRDEMNIEREKLAQADRFKTADLKQQTVQSNEAAGLPADFNFSDMVRVMQGQSDRDAEQTEAIRDNSEAIKGLAEIMAAPKEAILSNGRRVRIERTAPGVYKMKNTG